jgi:hypothetical protein
MRQNQLSRGALLLGGLLLPLLGAGCKNHLAFATSTKFGLDISQKANQTIDVTMGYQRVEAASIPVPADADATDTNDAYSVLGTFHVYYGDPFKQGENDGLHLKQFFATGMAARAAAGSANMRAAFGDAAAAIKVKQDTTKP